MAKNSKEVTKKKIPAVSIIIPMYNAEKYIGELLDSILAQTFDDFEVIVVDDGSNDKSRTIVAAYMSKFDDKLQLVKQKKNSGTPGVPLNEGIKISRGEYLLLLDNDDLIKNTLLEELYPIAKKFDADVVQVEKFYRFSDSNVLRGGGKDSLKPASYPNMTFVNEPTLMSNDFVERVQYLQQKKILWPYWTYLIRREFVIKNKLRFTENLAVDMIFTTCVMCSAERYVRVPNVVNFYRVLKSSLSHKQEDLSQTIHKYMTALIQGFQYTGKFLSEREFFKKHPDVKYAVLDIIVSEFVQYLLPIYAQIPAWHIDGLIRAEIEKFHDTTALTAFLFGRMNIFNVNFVKQTQMIKQLQVQNKNNN